MLEHEEMQLSGKPTMEKIMMAKAYGKGVPVNGSIELSPICNMNCDMCYVRLSPEETAKHGKLRTKEEWISLAEQMLEEGVLFLLLTGGEPLLYPDFKELYLALQSMGFIITINTNATLLDEKWADFFGENKPRRMNITLYGSNADTYEKLCHYRGGYEKTILAIHMLKERGVDVKIGCSVTKANYADVEDIARFCKEEEIPLVLDSYMMKARRERDTEFKDESRITAEEAAAIDLLQTQIEKEEYFTECAKRWLAQTVRNRELVSEGSLPENSSETLACMAGHCSFAVNWTGRLKPCVITPVPEVNVFEKGFSAAWQEIHNCCINLRRAEACIHCEIQHLCPSCPVAELVEEGSYGKAPEYLCRFAREKQRLLEEIVKDNKE